MTSTLESTTHSPRAVRRAAIVTHGKAQTIGPALARLEAIARDRGVELLFPPEEREKHGLDAPPCEPEEADIAIVLGGDGTMLRALARFLGTDVPVIGVNFGRVGFLASIAPDELEAGISRVFAGEYRVLELPTLAVEAAGATHHAVNDIVVHGSRLGRMVELAWEVGGEDLGQVPCDGVVVSTPSGSTAYNLSNGGPVLVRGLDAMAVTFVAPHSLHARPLVVPRGLDLVVRNRTPDVPVTVIVDGHPVTEVRPGGHVPVRLGDERSLLSTLPESTFFRRYRETFVRL
ncbi:MAG TPA: NAD(+)/NADH kinase [Gaiellaceae bacterium]